MTAEKAVIFLFLLFYHCWAYTFFRGNHCTTDAINGTIMTFYLVSRHALKIQSLAKCKWDLWQESDIHSAIMSKWRWTYRSLIYSNLDYYLNLETNNYKRNCKIDKAIIVMFKKTYNTSFNNSRFCPLRDLNFYFCSLRDLNLQP